MTLPLWCLFIAGLLHFLSKIPLGMAQGKASEGYNNSSPRSQQAQLSGWGARALAAHQNQIESFPIFAAGMIVAIITNLDPHTAGSLGMVYIAARVIFLFAYLKDLATFRSMVWIAGFFSSLALLCSPYWAV